MANFPFSNSVDVSLHVVDYEL